MLDGIRILPFSTHDGIDYVWGGIDYVWGVAFSGTKTQIKEIGDVGIYSEMAENPLILWN